MIDYISSDNYKILSDNELLNWKIFTEQKVKEYKNRLLNINRAIRKRGINERQSNSIDYNDSDYGSLRFSWNPRLD